MYCKYCKKNTHEIDNCQDIICKICKQYGHPHWKCKSKQQNKPKQPQQQQLQQQKSIKQNLNIADDNVKLGDFVQYLNVSWALF